MGFWFYICSMYFPYESNQFLEMEEGAEEMLEKGWLKIVENKRLIKKKSQTSCKIKFIQDLRSLLQEPKENDEDQENEEFRKCSVDDIINQLNKKLALVGERKNLQMSSLLKKIKENDKFLCSTENFYTYDAEDVLVDMRLQNRFSKKFVEYLISKHEKEKVVKKSDMKEETTPGQELFLNGYSSPQKKAKVILTRAEEEKTSNPDDVVCLICNDGDYEDNDLIVYCSSCHMTVHQNCYGIIDLPEGDWVCHPCRAFEDKSRDVECLLCPVRGGAMKPSTIKKNLQIANIIYKMRQGVIPNKNFTPSSDMDQIGINKNIYYFNENLQELTQEKTNVEKKFLFEELTDSEKIERQSKEFIESGVVACITDNSGEKPSAKYEEENETLKQTVSQCSPKKGRGRNRKIKNNKSKNKQVDQDGSLQKIDDFDSRTARSFAWVHLSCALWLPEVNIGDFAKKGDIKGKLLF